jgi:predicted transcriptional regulator
VQPGEEIAFQVIERSSCHQRESQAMSVGHHPRYARTQPFVDSQNGKRLLTALSRRDRLNRRSTQNDEVDMSSHPTSTLEDFHQFVGRQLASPTAEPMSPEQALALWRERQETLAAIRQGLADVEAGRTRPAEDVLRELRAKLGEA